MLDIAVCAWHVQNNGHMSAECVGKIIPSGRLEEKGHVGRSSELGTEGSE